MLHRLPLELLAIETMHSGHKLLKLTERLDWEDAPAYASELNRVLSGRGFRFVGDSVTTRIWKLEIADVELSFVWDDYLYAVTLESSDERGDAVIEQVRTTLLGYRSPMD